MPSPPSLAIKAVMELVSALVTSVALLTVTLASNCLLSSVSKLKACFSLAASRRLRARDDFGLRLFLAGTVIVIPFEKNLF
jgi:hypothetical protein